MADHTVKINLGCGRKLLPDHINVDKYPINKDVVYGDLNGRLPFENHSANEILLDNVIEHVDSIVQTMSEIHRILKANGKVRIITPHYSSAASWRDPTHLHHLSFFSFDYFCSGKNYIPSSSFHILHKRLSFGGGMGLIGRLFFKLSPSFYERHFAFVFPASTIDVTLQKLPGIYQGD